MTSGRRVGLPLSGSRWCASLLLSQCEQKTTGSTQTPIQTTLIETSLLTKEEKSWINAYHAEVLSKVQPLLEKAKNDRALLWLKRECKAI